MSILLALDESTQAMDEAVRLSRERGEPLMALFVLDGNWSDYTGHDWLSGSTVRGSYIEYAGQEDVKDSERLTAELRSRAEGIELEVKVVQGVVREELLKEARTGGYGLMVMAHPFWRGTATVRDTAKDLLGKLPCSLFLVNTPVRQI
ncbi:universal stress protein [Fundidesulfovibrio soli]|uniref:universal stress protein n=1 Tax=Fundidesulfovibrio soli TaxID=2922716 RepID=UPI001FAF602E|nr:universal stress protein [Fundidesulfovibrio soli]